MRSLLLLGLLCTTACTTEEVAECVDAEDGDRCTACCERQGGRYSGGVWGIVSGCACVVDEG